MPTIFEQYAPYRPAQLSEDEQQMMDVMFRSVDPLEGEIRIGLERATASLGQKWNYPEDPGITDKFPGVDPRGFYSEVDMALYDRYAKLAAALPARPPEVQAYVGGLLNQVAAKGTVLMQDWQRMRDTSLQLRNVTRAAKLAPTQRASDALLKNAQERVAAEADFQRMDGFLTAMEYAAGLSDKAPDERAVSYLRDTVHAPIPDEVMAVRTAPAAAPDTLSVHFQDFDHVVEQQFFANPRNWGKEPWQMPPDIANADAGALAVSRYAAATVDRTIQPLFEKVEQFSQGEFCDQLDRGALITVDGRTVRSLMVEQYTGEPNQFDKWYQENVREMTNQLVSAGLMAGKRVETFVPDAQGRLPKEPTQITKSGYEPSPLKKVTLNAWERHFAKHGFYKEKAAKAAEYQRVMEGREQVRIGYQSALVAQRSQALTRTETLFFSEYKQELGSGPENRLSDVLSEKSIHPGHGSFRLSRSAHVTACVFQLASQGYSVRDILDPNKLQAERQAAGKLYMEKAIAGDTNWLGATFYQGMQDLVGQAKLMTRLYDLSDREQLTDALPQFCDISRPLFDAFQEMGQSGNQEGFYLAAEAEHPGKGIEFGQELLERAAGVANIGELARKELRASTVLGTPRKGIDVQQELVHVLAGDGMRGLLKNRTDSDIFRRVTPDDVMILGPGLAQDPALRGMAAYLKQDPARIQAVGRMAQSGQLQDQVSVAVEQKMENGQPVFRHPTLPQPSLVRGEDGQLRLHVDRVPTPIPSLGLKVSPSKTFLASLEKQQKAQDFQKSHPKPEPKKDAPAKTSPQKAASQKAAPAKNPGGMKR